MTTGTMVPFLSFNPRVREGRDLFKQCWNTPGEVSIHASVKDATWPNVVRQSVIFVSIHASVKDATWEGG